MLNSNWGTQRETAELQKLSFSNNDNKDHLKQNHFYLLNFKNENAEQKDIYMV